MGSTTLTPTRPDEAARVDDTGQSGGGFRPGDFGGDDSGGDARVPERTYRLGMCFALTGIVMLFAAFTSALVVRKGMSFDWISIGVPRVLWLNTFVLLASSATLELSRRSLSAGSAREFIRWLSATVVLGLGFLGGQVIAWRELAGRGIYLATNPGSSFFYVLTAAHGIHLLGGVVALAYVVFRARRIAFGLARRTPLDVTAIYWHFMDALWIYLFFILLRWM
ncbi:MAG: heme-copper oxidase subunit III [Terriglobia bacterium]